ncbi:MAG: DUF4433 domain-containing protein [Armatimonadota bacterium]
MLHSPEKRVDSLYHLTHVRNLSSVLRHGIFSHDEAYRQGRIKKDVSDIGVQVLRDQKYDPIYHRPLHSYASLYFVPINPMLNQLLVFHQDIVILRIVPFVLFRKGALFTDGNAAANDTQFYSSPKELTRLRWDVLRAPDWNTFQDGKRIRCAEVLVYPRVPSSEIMSVYCSSLDQYTRVCRTLGPRISPLPITIRPGLFTLPPTGGNHAAPYRHHRL